MILAWLGLARAADTWFVSDPSRADELRAALAAEWPTQEAVVVVGPLVGTGLRWDGLELVWVDQEESRSAPADAATEAVLVARTWALTTEALGPERFLPEPPPPPPPPPRPPPPPPPPREWSLHVGAGGRYAALHATNGVRAVVGGSYRWATLDWTGTVSPDVPWQVQNLASYDRPVDSVGADRFTTGLAVGAMARNAVVSPRIGLGPELRRSESWLVYRGVPGTTGYGWDVAGVVTGGVEVSIGRVLLVPQAFVRGSAVADPRLELGATLDLTFRVW